MALTAICQGGAREPAALTGVALCLIRAKTRCCC
jgi:hypothetical protein